MSLGIKLLLLLLPAAPQCPSRGRASQPVVSLPLDWFTFRCVSVLARGHVQTELFTHILEMQSSVPAPLRHSGIPEGEQARNSEFKILFFFFFFTTQT